jgi:hypothetical protein
MVWRDTTGFSVTMFRRGSRTGAAAPEEKRLDCLYVPDTVHDVTIVDREQK